MGSVPGFLRLTAPYETYLDVISELFYFPFETFFSVFSKFTCFTSFKYQVVLIL